MAIAEMHKRTILVQPAYRGQLLLLLQGLQTFEPIDMADALGAGTSAQTPVSDSMVAEAQRQWQEIEEILAYVTPLLRKQKGWSAATTQRPSYPLKALEEQAARCREQGICQHIQALRAQRQKYAETVQQLQLHEKELRKWQQLPLTKAQRNGLRHVYVTVGTVANRSGDPLGAIQEQAACVVQELFANRDEIGILVCADRRDKQHVKAVLQAHHFTSYTYAHDVLPQEAIHECVAEQQRLRQADAAVVDQLAHMHDQVRALQLLSEQAYNHVERLRATQLICHAPQVSALSGWVTAVEGDRLEQVLRDSLPEGSFVVLQDTLVATDTPHMPTVLRNHPLVEPFEVFTEMYGLPTNDDVDPTPFFAPFYLVYFGMMVADIGYGLVLWLATWWAMRHLGLTAGARKNMRLFHLLSYPTMIWGAIYGSFMGLALPFRLLSTDTDATTVLGLSVLFGTIQLLFGIAINAVLHTRKGNWSEAYRSGYAWLGIFIGIIAVVIGQVAELPLVATVGQWVAIANAVGIVVVATGTAKNKAAGFASGLYQLYGVSSYVGDLVSFTRLMALSISGASIAAAFNLIISFFPPVARFTVGAVLFLLLQGLNLFLSVLGGYVHGARLQFVEFFNKFYQGGGRPLRPLKAYEKYVTIKKED